MQYQPYEHVAYIVSPTEQDPDSDKEEFVSVLLCKCGMSFEPLKVMHCIICNGTMNNLKHICKDCSNSDISSSICRSCLSAQLSCHHHQYCPGKSCKLLMRRSAPWDVVKCDKCRKVHKYVEYYWCTHGGFTEQYILCLQCASKTCDYCMMNINHKSNSKDDCKYPENDSQPQEDNEMQIMMKLSSIQARITDKLGMIEIENLDYLNAQDDLQQDTVLGIIDLLKDMRNLSSDYYDNYCDENKWTHQFKD